MIRNDYRRALIMLRGLDKGLTGHVRLERRTLMGTMQFTVSGASASETLCAALLTRDKGRWLGAKLGILGRDGRGQAGLNASFDPRNIEGLELEQYSLIIVVGGADDHYRLLMSGYVNGVVDVDWAQIHEAAKALYAPATEVVSDGNEQTPVTALPDESNCCENEDEYPVVEETETAYEEKAPIALEKEDVECCCETETAIEKEIEEVIQPQAAVENQQKPAPLVLSAVTLDEVAAMDTQEKEALEKNMPAGLLLDLDITEKWPPAIEALRSIFLQERAITPFEAPGYVFVTAPLPGAKDISTCAVGIKCENKRPISVCYGIPGSFQPDNPAGMEGYQWVNDKGEGWWVIHVDAESGEHMDA